MGSFWRVDLDQQMFAIAQQRPYIWKYLLLNDYMRAGNPVDEYLEVMRTPGKHNLKHLTGRFPRAEDAETIANNLFSTYTGFQVAELRRLVINLFNILAHLKSMLSQADQDSDKVCKPDFIVAMCAAFIRAFKQEVPEIPKDSTGAIKAVIAFFENGENFGEVPSGHEVQTLQNNLFQLSRGDSLEKMNPCQMMQNLYRASLKLLLPKYSDKDFIVGGLPVGMCTAQQCCDVPFEYGDIQQNRVDKTFKQIEGFNRLAPDVNLADTVPDPRIEMAIEQARIDFFLLLRCSSYFNLDVRTGRLAMPMNDAGWQRAYFDEEEFFLVPVFNYVRLRAILEAVKQLDAGSKLPIVIGESKGRLGNRYVLDLKSFEKPTPMEVEKPEKSVHWKDLGRAGVESQTAIAPYKKQGDTSQGVILMIVAAALVAVKFLI